MDEIKESKEKFKFKLKTFLIYTILWPWTERMAIPNLSTVSLIALFISLLIRNFTFVWISFGAWIIFYGIKEWKSGEFIYWYRQMKYRKRNETLKKAREEKRKRFINEINN